MGNTKKVKEILPSLKFPLLLLSGALAGFLNGFLGSGGGIILIFAMTYLCRDTIAKERFSTAVASVLPMSAVSALIYISNGSLRGLFTEGAMLTALAGREDIAESQSAVGLARFLIPGALGGIFGSFVMDKISPRFLKLIFAALMVFAGARMVIR